MASLRAPGRNPVFRAIAHVLVATLIAAIPTTAEASVPASETDKLTKSAFGELLSHVGSDPQPYAFAGEPHDPNVGFQYHRARWMDPRTGRFVAVDPFVGAFDEPLTLPKYLYGLDDPLNRTDPTGLLAGDYSLPAITTAQQSSLTIRSQSIVPYRASLSAVKTRLVMAGVIPVIAGIETIVRRVTDDDDGEHKTILYHGTTSNRAGQIVGGEFYDGQGFRPNRVTWFGEDFATAAYYARVSAARNNARNATVLEFSIPTKILLSMPNLAIPTPIGMDTGLPWEDIPGGSGFERILRGDAVPAFNAWLYIGWIRYRRLRL